MAYRKGQLYEKGNYMKRKIALLTAICLLTGCSSSGVNSLNAADAGQNLELPELSQDQQDEVARLVRSDNKDFMANGIPSHVRPAGRTISW